MAEADFMVTRRLTVRLPWTAVRIQANLLDGTEAVYVIYEVPIGCGWGSLDTAHPTADTE